MKVPESDDQLAAVKRLISSLSGETSSVRSFRAKWLTVGFKLSNLRAHLSDLPTASSPLSADLLRSAAATLSGALSLAASCRSPSPAAGKLRTQSDLDAVAASLDRHIQDAAVLLRSGVLHDPTVDSISGGKSTASSKSEGVRAEARSLVTRLQIGSRESKNAAMEALLDLLQKDDKNVLIAVAQGAVPVLVRLLDSCCAEMKEKAVSAISRVSMVDSSKHVLMAEGIFLLNHLLRVLESGSGFAKEKACVALQALTFSKENARAVGSRGGISSLLEICDAGTPGSQAAAAGVLRNLAVVRETKENFMEENAIGVLLRLSASGTALAKENAIGCLCNLVSDDVHLKLLIAREGVVESLSSFWDGAPAVRSLEVAVELVRSLAACHSVGEVLVSNGFVNRLISVLNCGVLGVRIGATNAIYELGSSSKARKEMGECGCVGPLIRMLEGKAVEEREAAARALSTLLLCGGNKKIFKKDGRGIVSAVQLLDPSVKNLDKRYPVSVLASVVHCKNCRKQMVANGACLQLQKLVEMDVEGARRLLDCLTHGKLWNFLADHNKK